MIESKKILDFFTTTIAQGASDLHLSTGSVPLYRLDGELHKAGQYGTITAEEIRQLIKNITEGYQRSRFFSEKREDIDLCLDIPGASRCRGNIFRTLQGEAVVLRVIPPRIPSMQTLGLPLIAKDLVLKPSGLLLVTGKSGHGKTTSLASMVDFLNEKFNYHIVSIEDPIEFIHEPKLSHISQRQVSYHCGSFPDAIRSSLRENADVIIVGEVRDQETATWALHASETGSLVIATLHTRSAVETVNRYTNFFPDDSRSSVRSLLADVIVGIISQNLVVRANGKGRVLAAEVMVGNAATGNLIRDNKTHMLSTTLQTSNHQGMQTLDQSLADLVREGAVKWEEAYRLCVDKNNFPKKI